MEVAEEEVAEEEAVAAVVEVVVVVEEEEEEEASGMVRVTSTFTLPAVVARSSRKQDGSSHPSCDLREEAREACQIITGKGGEVRGEISRGDRKERCNDVQESSRR